jgi:hypothetical protein
VTVVTSSPSLEDIYQYKLLQDSGVAELTPFAPKLGWDIYENPFSETGLNREVPEGHAAFALLGAKVEKAEDGRLPVDPQELLIRLVSQGSVVLIKHKYLSETKLNELANTGGSLDPEDYFFLDHVCYDALRPDIDPQKRALLPPFGHLSFAQQMWGIAPGKREPQIITRLFSRIAEGQAWVVADYVDWEDLSKRRVVQRASLPADALIIEPWGLGWLWPAQKILHRLENISVSLERLQSGINAKTLIFGYIGDTGQASTELRRADRDVALLPGEARADRVASTAQIDQLISEFHLKLDRFMRTVHMVYVSDKSHVTDGRTVWQVVPMVSYTSKLQDHAERILKQVGITVQFVKMKPDLLASGLIAPGQQSPAEAKPAVQPEGEKSEPAEEE